MSQVVAPLRPKYFQLGSSAASREDEAEIDMACLIASIRLYSENYELGNFARKKLDIGAKFRSIGLNPFGLVSELVGLNQSW